MFVCSKAAAMESNPLPHVHGFVLHTWRAEQSTTPRTVKYISGTASSSLLRTLVCKAESTPSLWCFGEAAVQGKLAATPHQCTLCCAQKMKISILVMYLTARNVKFDIISLYQMMLLVVVGWLMSQQHDCVSEGGIRSDKCTYCHTEIEVTDQTCYLIQSQYTDMGKTSLHADPITPGASQGRHWSTGMTRPGTNPTEKLGVEDRVCRSRGGHLNQ